jgi:hypothetical protein
MRYLYYELGEQQEESWVIAHLRGSAANVILLDPLNFDRYRFGEPFLYTGGLYTRTPVRLQIPHDGEWYLVIDCGGYQHHVRARNIEVLTSREAEADATHTGAAA